MPASGGKPRQVTTTGGLVAFESHNGDMLLFTKPGSGGLWEMGVGGGPESKVLENVVDRNFMPTADGIYFVRRTDQGYSFQFYSSASGHVHSFGSTQRHVGNVVTVSPDGRRFAYAQQDHAGSDIIVVENFR
jgi:hypothetical protein